MAKDIKIKVVVAMSGGVDSSVSAALLKEAGFDVIGVFMKFWSQHNSKAECGTNSQKINENRCCSSESEKRARMVAKQLNIPFYVINMENEFKKKIVDYFISEYKSGKTPNPCVACNYEIKFGLFIEKALKMGARYIATGHYARISNGKLLKGADKDKDQSYFLWRLTAKQLEKVLFPVGGYKKPEVRKLAKKLKLPTAETPESQEVCFVNDSTSDFLRKYIKNKPGDIINKDGKILGEHNGLWFYTIGQRKGIGLSNGPYYVINKDTNKNTLIVSNNKKDLLRKELIAKDVNWISKVKFPLKVKAKIRYRHKDAPAVVYKLSGKKVKLKFTNFEKAITSGQSVVFYLKDELLGGGIII